MSDSYYTLQSPGRAERKVEGSRFVADAIPVPDRAAAEASVADVRSREHKATHHCSAFRVGVDGEVFHYDDDGEPTGTGGRPILRQIDARDLTNTLVVVTRHFGGTELGTGGLARAYGEAAEAALEDATIMEAVVRVPVRLRYEYEDTAPAEQVLRQFDVEELESRYTEVTRKTVGVPRSEVEAFVRAFTDALGGRGTVGRVGENGDDGA
ncbi:MAG: IMPACT family protein [Salinivenus sp.]